MDRIENCLNILKSLKTTNDGGEGSGRKGHTTNKEEIQSSSSSPYLAQKQRSDRIYANAVKRNLQEKRNKENFLKSNKTQGHVDT